jgi:hypothetical protein
MAVSTLVRDFGIGRRVRSCRRPVSAGNCVTACELVVFTDGAADPVPPEHANAGCLLSTAASGSWLGRAFPGAKIGLRSMRGIWQVRRRRIGAQRPGRPFTTSPRPNWSRPMRIVARSVLARTRGYAPVASSTRSPTDSRPSAQTGTSRHFLIHLREINRTEERTLNQRVGGSSPSRRTVSDLGLCRSQVIFSCPICPRAGSVLARVFLGRSCAAVKLSRIGLDQSGEWSRPLRWTLWARLESPIAMSSRSVISAGSGHSSGR